MALAAAHVLLAAGVTGHVVLTKPDPRAAIGWAGLVWFAPVLGFLLYVSFGINRIRRRAGRMRRRRVGAGDERRAMMRSAPIIPPPSVDGPAPRALAALVGAVTRIPLAADNAVQALLNGDEAYPAMLAAVDAATRSVALATYIFDRGEVATRFIDALARAVGRGVAVRVLIDAVGSRYSHPPTWRAIKARGIPVARFLPSAFPVLHPYINLRNHRKLLVTDGRIGFCGGMNIRDGCLLALGAPEPTQDMHFRITGPVVRHLMTALAFDWTFVTGETLAGDAWFPALGPAGAVFARGIADGPDEDFEALLLTLLGTLSEATQSVRIVTPYFLPDPPVVDALRVAALRGVKIEIVLPEKGNLRAVQWAATARLAQLVRGGCRVFLSRPPFDHSKLLVVDDRWCLIGSANWDPRSLRLNFEYGVECYSTELAGRLNELIDGKRAVAREVALAELDGRSLPIRLRDGLAWLAQPYL
jgi:cardiolipin synthase A/B